MPASPRHFPPTARPAATLRRGVLLSLCGLLLAPLASARLARNNYAKYQPASASISNGTYVADFAVDGIVSNFHSHRTGSQTGPFWIELTYPRALTLASAHLYLGQWINATPAQVPSTFRLQYHDGLDWADIPGTAVSGNTATEVNLIFTPAVTASRFRFHCSNSGSFTLREIALFPPHLSGGTEQGHPLGTDVRLNLAHERPASASSAILNNQYGPGYARNAFDGYLDNTSRWLCTSAAGEWLEIDLLDSHRIGSAHVYTGFLEPADLTRTVTQPMADFKLQSWDGAAWVDIPGATITGNTAVARTIVFSEAVTTSRVRLVTSSAFNARVQELQLYPPRDAGGTYPLREAVNAAPPAQTWDLYSDSTYRLRSKGPDLRLGLVNGQVIYTPAHPTHTDWQLLLNHRDGSYRIRHVPTGLCLALAAVSPTAGTQVTAQEYTAQPHQDWWILADPTTADTADFRLVNVHSGLTLQSLNSSWASGSLAVVQPAVAGLTVQLWNANFQRHHPKKGLAGTNNPIASSSNPYTSDPSLTFIEDFHRRLNGAWSYSWGRQTSSAFPFMGPAHGFNPMQWGNFNFAHGSGQGPLETIHRDLQSNPRPVYLMGFNEPDKIEQSNVSVTTAISRWPRLLGQDAPLVSPAPASAFNGWLEDFSTQADALGYRRDYTAAHWYANPSADSLINNLNSIYTTFGRPVWLTEFSTVRWSGTTTWTLRDNFNFLAEFMWRAEALTWLKRYSLFAFIQNSTSVNQGAPDPAEAPRSNALRADGSLTAFGQLYAGWDGVTSVVNHRTYHLQNKGVYHRLHNPGGTAGPASLDPETEAPGVQWFLTPGVTANTVRLLSTRDGRPLRYTGSAVALGTAGQTDTTVEWRVVAELHGWNYLEHPAAATSARRLRNNSNGTFTMVSSTSTADQDKWRFVAPAPILAEAAGPPAAPTDLGAVAAPDSLALTWAAVPGATSYKVERATSEAGTWTQVATGLTTASWTDTGLPFASTYYYRVTATSVAALDSASSAAIAAATLPNPDPYAAWAGTALAAAAEADRLPAADPDRDGLANLLEYALATDPLLATPGQPATSLSGDSKLQLTFHRARAELTYEVLASGDLTTWSVLATNPGTAGQQVTVTDTVALTAGVRRFLRLRVATSP